MAAGGWSLPGKTVTLGLIRAWLGGTRCRGFPLLTVSSGRTNPTGSVSLNIVVTNFTGVTGLQFSMDWDPALLSYTGVTAGGLPLFGSGNLGLT